MIKKKKKKICLSQASFPGGPTAVSSCYNQLLCRSSGMYTPGPDWASDTRGEIICFGAGITVGLEYLVPRKQGCFKKCLRGLPWWRSG